MFEKLLVLETRCSCLDGADRKAQPGHGLQDPIESEEGKGQADELDTNGAKAKSRLQ